MFGMPTLKIRGTAFAGTYGEAMIFKLSPTDVQRALQLAGASHFDPRGGRPMREWVSIPPERANAWPDLARSALEYVSGLQKS